MAIIRLTTLPQVRFFISTNVLQIAIARQPRSIDVIMTISLGFLYFFLSVGCFSVCW
ncbi:MULTISPECIES: hypothetical protein [unclassified Microcystis]|uniref:hypothetical protein n=1 Tax=unclassified Microcystis TaxID=2643300 RepID=UPI002583A010|nr:MULTISPECIES: hypothetical protein [unclassified Microcystis]MCA2773427.1 hypothetical protein [Microcystis sp. M122S2]MCA2818572.1 hypothetical protein [Microcystis sp. M085S1]MCA2822912.1 hypothetical protein [Microcystis sp. M083S1]MCA2853445.1 hypothetical protein [Microcystis sp. M065S1]MCA2882755.1 hypothetical protein [Microcystis sp. M046S1]MCA2904145.1 hypothetical protein [Microcystis sp. M042S1]